VVWVCLGVGFGRTPLSRALPALNARSARLRLSKVPNVTCWEYGVCACMGVRVLWSRARASESAWLRGIGEGGSGFMVQRVQGSGVRVWGVAVEGRRLGVYGLACAALVAAHVVARAAVGGGALPDVRFRYGAHGWPSRVCSVLRRRFKPGGGEEPKI